MAAKAAHIATYGELKRPRKPDPMQSESLVLFLEPHFRGRFHTCRAVGFGDVVGLDVLACGNIAVAARRLHFVAGWSSFRCH